MPEELKVENNKVKGCQSQVWLACLNGIIRFQGDSDAAIEGNWNYYLYFDGFRQWKFSTKPTFIDDIGLRQHLP